MACWVCDKNPVKGTKHGRELCFRHYELVKVCIICGNIFVAKRKEYQVCIKCDKSKKPGYSYVKKDYSVINCLVCENSFKPKAGNHKYCSLDCQKAATRDKLAKRYKAIKVAVNCLACGQTFNRKNPHHKYCTPSCAKSVPPYHEKDRLIIFDRDKFQCIYCGETSYKDCKRLHIDHIIPKSKGGSDCASNLVTSCIQCNLAKYDCILFNLSSIQAEVQGRNKQANIDPRQVIKLLPRGIKEESSLL